MNENEQLHRKTITKRVENRPRSSEIFSKHDTFSRHTSYALDYAPKAVSKPIIIRTRRARNNPHPSEAFMVWHLRSQLPPLKDPLVASNLKLWPQPTTYQDGYLSILKENRTTLKRKCRLHKIAGTTKNCHVTSTMQHDYQIPRLSENLRGNTTRYGCNVGIVKAARGVVPTLEQQTMHTSKKPHLTWYSSEFGSRENKGHHTMASAETSYRALHLPLIKQ